MLLQACPVDASGSGWRCDDQLSLGCTRRDPNGGRGPVPGAGARWPCRAQRAQARGRDARPSPSRPRGARTGRVPRPGTASLPRSRCRSGRRARPDRAPRRGSRARAGSEHREGMRAVGGPPEPPLEGRRQPPGRPGLFGRFPGTMSRSNFSGPFVSGVRPEPSRCGPEARPAGGPEISRFPRRWFPGTHVGLGPRRAGAHLDHHGARRGGLPLLWDGPLPLPGSARLAGPLGERSESNADRGSRIDLGKNSCSLVGLDEAGRAHGAAGRGLDGGAADHHGGDGGPAAGEEGRRPPAAVLPPCNPAPGRRWCLALQPPRRRHQRAGDA